MKSIMKTAFFALSFFILIQENFSVKLIEQIFERMLTFKIGCYNILSNEKRTQVRV